jgi:hypothetical protein
MKMVSLQAHFDGNQILLDEPFQLNPNARLIVTLVPNSHTDDDERQDWLTLSLLGLQGAYDDDEPEYPLTTLKRFNPDYDPR